MEKIIEYEMVINWVEIRNWITLAIALLGAYLGIRNALRDRRRLLICLMIQEKMDYRHGTIRLINIGHRPITIISIVLWVDLVEVHKKIPIWKNRPIWVKLEGFQDLMHSPVTLTDGQDTTILLSKSEIQDTWNKGRRVHVTAYDAEGLEHINFKVLWQLPGGEVIHWKNWPWPLRYPLKMRWNNSWRKHKQR